MIYFGAYIVFMGIRGLLIAFAGNNAINWKYDQPNWKEIPDIVPTWWQMAMMFLDIRKWTTKQFFPMVK